MLGPESPDGPGALRQRVRREALRLLDLLASDSAWLPTDGASLAELARTLTQLLHVDQPRNAELALRLLCAPSLAARALGPLQQVMESLRSYCAGVVAASQAAPAAVVRPEEPESRAAQTAGRGVHSRDPTAPAAATSTRLVPAVVRLATVQLEAGEPALLKAVAPRAWQALKSFPADVLPQVRNRRLYWKYLHGVTAELLAVLDLAWKQHPQALEVTLAQTAVVQLHILGNLPPGADKLRLSILQRLEAGLAAEVRDGQARRGALRVGGGPGDANQGGEGSRQQPNVGQGLPGQAPGGSSPTLTEVLGTTHREWVIDSVRMQGKGRPNAAVQVGHAGIFRILGQQQVPFETNQIVRVMKIICRSLLDSSVALS